ncbi:P-loop containing nucleoside triphosphate hydrolase protein [Macrolepiota fuliginosa MF-IS2]|uniref:P-loop containing nucleoside triphosphate hydrolase protein n=1 Tax=Macrolepiota fuliginosa MF-IS2 TaxID=1400762 RepID=A0A9P5XHU1_9AGAR|nr:P-loop containing nucleoside triphosphate hydrolase protein [Macrolepiota fuliginosa MF-IS2]
MAHPHSTEKPTEKSSLLSQIVSIGMIASWLPGQRSGISGTLSMFIMGWLLEMGKDAYNWFSERWKFQYSLTAEFQEGDPAYDWILAFLTKERVWRRSWNFKISAKTLQLMDGIESSEVFKGHNSENAEYVPTYRQPQLFRWNGWWIEITRTSQGTPSMGRRNPQPNVSATSSTIFLTVYTRDISAISALVEHARKIYMEMSQPHVIIHSCNQPGRFYPFHWNDRKRKARRPLDSVILEAGILDSIVADAREFLGMETWYQAAGIPYRRGYLLYGPPGSGKTSTIYALAGELGVEIYSLSLASNGVDDTLLASALASIPKRSIFILEDIDCAFSRDDESTDFAFNPNSGIPMAFRPARRSKSNVTLSGLLNILDGVASQEGILFFATTNHIEDLDNALIRPGRIDMKIEYHHAVRQQAVALYKRFFPISHCTPESAKAGISDEDKASIIDSLANGFAERVPEMTFTAAELQGFLLTCKFKPEKAVNEVKEWADKTIQEKKELEEKKKEKQEKVQEKRDMEEAQRMQSTFMKMNYMGENLARVPRIETAKEKGGPKTESMKSDLLKSAPSPASGTQSPGPKQESESESWTIEPTPEPDVKREPEQ